MRSRIEEYRTEAQTCPGCAHKIDAATGWHGEHPRIGDLAVCLYCGLLLVYTIEGLGRATERDRSGIDPRELAAIEQALGKPVRVEGDHD